jgi:hypothetical protein
MYPLRANNVIQLYEGRDQVNLEPPYQRLSIWDREKKQSFIDSVINAFDIPKLYFHRVPPTSEQSGQYKYAVIDGKQRLLALWEFMSNSLPLSKDFVFFEDPDMEAGGCKYDELVVRSPRLRARFDSFDVPVTVVDTDDENFVEELFTRLNVQVPLSAAERRNALGGPLPYIIRRIGVSPFFLDSAVMRNDRLQHFDLAAKFLYLTHADAIESTKRPILDAFVRDFRRRRDEGGAEASVQALDDLQARTERILDSMHDFFGQRSPLLASQGRATLYFQVFRIHQNAGRRVPFSKQVLERFNEEVTSARKKSQRVALGSREVLSHLEAQLVAFDREKQSANDAGALRRQYGSMKRYLSSVLGIELVEADRPAVVPAGRAAPTRARRRAQT